MPPTTHHSFDSTSSADITATASLWLVEKKPAVLSSNANVPESFPGKGCDIGRKNLTSDFGLTRSSGMNKVKTKTTRSVPSFTEDDTRDQSDNNDDDTDRDHDDGKQEDRSGNAGTAGSDHSEETGGAMLNGQPGSMSLDSEELKCLLCSESFTEADQLTVHMQAHSADMAHRCDVCGAAFLLPDVLQQHKKMHPHQKRQTKVSSVTVSPSISKQEQHGRRDPSHAEPELPEEEANSAEPEQSCSKTDKADNAENKRKPDKGALNSQDEEAGMYDEDTDTELDRDLGMGLRSKEQCPEVGQQPPSGQSSAMGGNDESRSESPLQTKQVSVTEQRKKAEQQTASDSDLDKWCGCQHCGQSFCSLNTLVTHARSHFSQVKLHCRTCSKTFHSSSLLEAHPCPGAKHKMVHLKQCGQCHREFSTAAGLARHMRTHTKTLRARKSKRPAKKVQSEGVCQLGHICDVCFTMCSTAGSLRQHKRMKHEERRKFQCGHCGKELCNMQTLTTHERTHTGKK